MAISNLERIQRALDLLRDGLVPFVERELKAQHAQQWLEQARSAVGATQERLFSDEAEVTWDAAALLAVLWNQWHLVFRKTLGQAERTLVSELRDVRNRWAHQEPFSGDDTDRALDSVARLLTAVSAPQADEVQRMKQELRRLIYDEQVRNERRKAGGSLIEGLATGAVKAWREVVTPHADVASGRYQQAEFAADLWQVHLGEGSPEYRDPEEFFRRTYLTESLKGLLAGAIQRVNGRGGDPVVQLQTNFGGGKTHSMLALYHLFGGTPPAELAGVDTILAEAGIDRLPAVRRVVLVGNKISPGNPVRKPDGTVVRTLWGELAWQLGGERAFARLAADDERGTSPGDALRELFREYGPCLVLIDEWVAYARQLHDQSDLPGGSFEAQFTFAQALTESAKAAGNCLLVISLPASDTHGSPHTAADDVEVGGLRGREALDRLRNVVGRLESSWRPATAEEGFEIVRRRLFEPLGGAGAFKQRDLTARAFSDHYRSQAAEFPNECRSAEYERRIQAAYPIHPEVFDRLYTDWSTLVKFQRTRGVLRLMAAVIHSLWERGDRSPLILPATIPIDDPRVQSELTRYLSDNWAPILEKDVDGPSALPLQIDGEKPNLGKLSATRRVARAIYLGSAPTASAAHRGIEDRQIKLGCVLPGESPAIFGDALRYLAARATYLYQDGPRFWYATQPTVTKLAEDRAEQLRRDPDRVTAELERRLRDNLARRGAFSRVHPVVRSAADVPDDHEAKLVVLPAEQPYSRDKDNPAERAATAILESRGTSPRLFRNTLVFLAADKVRLQDLDEALRRLLAWESILGEREILNLDPHQVRQAEARRQAADATVVGQLPEAYQWLLVPEQLNPDLPKGLERLDPRRFEPRAPVTWQAIRVSGSEPLAERASRRLRSGELLLTNLGASILRKHLDDVPLWRGDHVAVRQLVSDFAQYLYLPRLTGPEVLLSAIESGCGLLTWRHDSFAYAEGFDEEAGRYRALHGGERVTLAENDSGLLVRPEMAQRQMDEEAPLPPTAPGSEPETASPTSAGAGRAGAVEPPRPAPRPKRYYGEVELDPERAGRDAGKIAEEVLVHLTTVAGATVKVTLAIEASAPDGFPENVVRIVAENGRVLKFTTQEFAKE